ncbi:hypothetical protein Ddc_18279 [Ditylenchus destructor]|nr:hypothetical protein Ddc_18279 [Ditylenchus destructor]
MADHYSGDGVNAENAAGNLQQKEICVGCKRAGGDVFPAIFNGKLSKSCLCDDCRSLMQDSKSDVSCTNGGTCDNSSDCNPCRISRIFKATGVPVGILVCNCCGRKEGDAKGFSMRHKAPDCCNTCAKWFHENYQKPHTCMYGTTYECSMIQKPDDITTVRCKGCKLQRCRILGMKHKNESHKRDNDNLQDGPPPKITATSEAISSEGNVGQQFLTDDTMPRPEILVNNSLPESDTLSSVLNANIDSVNSMDFEPSKFEQLLESVVSPPPKITTTSEAISSEGNVGEQPSGDEIMPRPETLVNDSLPESDILSPFQYVNIDSVDSMDFEPLEFEQLVQAVVSPQTQESDEPVDILGTSGTVTASEDHLRDLENITATCEVYSSEDIVERQPLPDDSNETMPRPEIPVNNSMPESDTLSPVKNANIVLAGSMDFVPQELNLNYINVREFEQLYRLGASPRTQDKLVADQSLEKHVLAIKTANILEITKRKLMKVDEICKRGDDCYFSGDKEMALVFYSDAINHFGHSYYYSRRAATYCDLKRYKEGLQDAEEAIRRNPSLEHSRSAYEAKIFALHAFGKDAEMLEWVEQQSEKFRGNEEFVECIGRVANRLCTAKKYNLCCDFLGKQLEKFPDSQMVRDLLDSAELLKLSQSKEISDEPEDIPGTSGTQTASAADDQLNDLLCKIITRFVK